MWTVSQHTGEQTLWQTGGRHIHVSVEASARIESHWGLKGEWSIRAR